MSEQADRRRSPRISCDLPVECVATEARILAGRIANIGLLGFLVLTQEASPPVGSDLLLRFHLPLSHRPIQAQGIVRWVKVGKVGVEFAQLSLQVQDEIWKYYARKVAEEREQDPWRRLIHESEPPWIEPE